MDRGIDGELDRWLDVQINRMREGEISDSISRCDIFN